MTLQTPSPQFTQLIQNNIAYFQQMVSDKADDALYAEQHNIRRAILMGLQVAKTTTPAADLLQTMEPFIEHWSSWQKWISLWQRALENQTDSPKRWQIQTQLAFFHRMNGNYKESTLLLHDVLAHLDPNEQEAWVGKSHFHLGYSLFYLKQYDKARYHAQIAFTMFDHNPTIARGGTAPAQNLLGLINLHTSNPKSAIKHFKEARHDWQQSGHQDYVFVTLLNEAVAYESCRQFDDAMNCYQQCILYTDKSDRLFSKAQVYLNMGTLYSYQEKWQETYAAYIKIDKNALYQHGYIDLYVRLTTSLGHAIMELGSFETAVSYLQEAISLWRQLEDAVMLANALDSLGDTHLRLQQPDTARDCYQEGLMLVQQHPNDYIAQQLHATFIQKLTALYKQKG